MCVYSESRDEARARYSGSMIMGAPRGAAIPGSEPLWVLAGASGRVGRMLVRHWQSSPPDGLRIVPQYREGGLPGVIWSPLEGAGPLLQWAAKHGDVAGLMMLAGVTPGQGADLDANAALARAAVDAARAVGVRRVLVASSSAVYGAGVGHPLDEDAPTLPVNDYGRAKLAAEAACADADDLDLCCLRIGNVAGADALLRNAVHARTDAPLRLDRFADGGGPIRSYIGPATLAHVLETLARQPEPLPRVLNIGAPQPVAMQALAEAAAAPHVMVDAPATALQHITLDCTRLAALHGFAPDDSDAAGMVAQWQAVKDRA